MTDDSNKDADLKATRTTQSAGAMLRAGEILADRYRIEDTVGVGAMGVVYRAFDQRLKIDVALKILHVTAAGDPEAMQRFESELKLARQVTHPNVVRIHDIGEHERLTFLTMDLIEGRSLADVIATEGTLAPDRAAAIASGIARGLAAAHANGVVHRDLKPANILIDHEDQAYISDFGVARSIASARMTQTGVFVGTPDYLAPEQARGDTVDGRADIYALGLILYEMIAGKTPFEAASFEELVVQRTLGKAPNLTRTGLAAPDDVRRVIRRCLQKKPEDRYQDATMIARELSSGHSPRRLSPAIRRGAIVASIVIAGVLLARTLIHNPAQPESGAAQVAAPAPPSVTFAILPFLDVPVDPALAWISTGVVESMTVELTASSYLDVIPKQRIQTTLEDLKIAAGALPPDTARQLAELFGASWLVSGTLTTRDNQVSIEAVMVPADPTITQRALGPVTANLENVTELGAQIVSEIRNVLSLPVPTRRPLRLSANLDALRGYATGVDLLALGDSVGALTPLQEAVAKDASFAAAWLKLAETYAALGRDNEAITAIERAVTTSGDSNSRVAEMARVRQAELAGDYDSARTQLERIVASEPGDSAARFMLAEMVGDEGRFSEAIKMLESIVADDPNHPRAWFLLGKFAIQNGDSQRALSEYLRKGLEIQEKLNNLQGKADVLNAMGIAEHRTGQLEQARSRYQRAADIREEIGDQRGLASSLANIARINLQLGQYDDAAAALDQAIEVRTALGDQSGLAGLYNVYGVLHEEKGDYRGALRRYRQALKIREDAGNRRDLGNSYNNVAFAYFVLGEYDNAGVYWQLALDESISTDNPDAQMLTRQSLGQLRLAQGEWSDAIALFLSSLEASRQSGYPDAEAVALGNLGRVAQQQGRYEAALSSYADALEILDGLDDVRGQAEFTLWRADTWLELNNNEAAAVDIATVSKLLAEAGNDEQRAMLHALSGSLALRANKSDVATRAFDEALAAAHRSGSDIPVIRTLIVQAEASAPGTVDDVSAVVDTIRHIGNTDLTMRALMVGIRDHLAKDDLASAAQYAEELKTLLNAHRPYANAWLGYRLCAVAASRRGDTAQAEDDMAESQSELRRIVDAMPQTAREGFESRARETGPSLP